MTPTLYQVYDGARAALGEHEVPGGEEINDNDLSRYVDLAIKRLHAAFRNKNLDFPERTTYYLLPAHQGFWRPTLSGVAAGIPTDVRAANVDSSATVTAATTSGTLTFSASHSFALGDRVGIYGVVGLRRGRYNDAHRVVTIPGASQINVGDVEEVGTWTSGGTVVKFSNLSSPWSKVDDLDSVGSSIAGDAWEWSNESLKLVPQDTQRLLQIRYRASGALPTLGEDLVGVDGSAPFLSYYAASMAAHSLGARQAARDLHGFATGHPDDRDSMRGYLGDVIRPAIHAMQDETIVVGRYRPRRETDVWGYD